MANVRLESLTYGKLAARASEHPVEKGRKQEGNRPGLGNGTGKASGARTSAAGSCFAEMRLPDVVIDWHIRGSQSLAICDVVTRVAGHVAIVIAGRKKQIERA